MSKFYERYWMLWEEARDKNYKTTREQFADSLGVSPGQSNGWLRGTSEPDCDTLAILARKANVSVAWLVGATNIRKPEVFCPLVRELPTEAVDEVMEFIKYIRFKYHIDACKPG